MIEVKKRDRNSTGKRSEKSLLVEEAGMLDLLLPERAGGPFRQENL